MNASNDDRENTVRRNRERVVTLKRKVQSMQYEIDRLLAADTINRAIATAATAQAGDRPRLVTATLYYVDGETRTIYATDGVTVLDVEPWCDFLAEMKRQGFISLEQAVAAMS